ncbi:MAG TPA: TonB-dependent receptor, partial [Candidatus Aminicenantes bacterium]|nr:TonB-dependent receptor [Candidatus Aminicenantes bacterium]
ANTWAIDGIDVTDPVELGASTVRFDFDAIEAIAVTTGGAADVTQPTGGIAVNILTRRGGNALGGSARLYLTDNAFQAGNLTDALRDEGVSNTNRIERITDYGFNVGGPIFKNRLWLWGAYGAQDVFTYTILDTPDRALYSNAGFKLNAEPFRGNSFEAFFMTSAKDRYGVNSGFAKPEGDRLSGLYRLGGPIGKIQDSQSFGRSFTLSAKYVWTRTGQRTKPMVDPDLTNPVVFDVSEGRYVAFSDDLNKSWDYSEVIQENGALQVSATLFRDDLLGLDHEIKGGVEFSNWTQNSDAGYAQNYRILRNLTEPLIDLGEGLVVPPADWQYVAIERENRRSDRVKRSSAYLQDTMTSGRLTLQLGLRYDYQEPSSGSVGLSTVVSGWTNAFASDTMTNLQAVFPSLSIKAIDPKYEWSTWSPRIGLSWDLKGDGRTVLKLALAQYGDILAAGANVPRPLGIAGNLNFWWNDADEDSVIDLTEVFWKYSPAHPEAPNQLYALFASGGGLTAEALEAVEGGFEGDAYLAGNYAGYDWEDREAVNYDSLTTFFRSDIDPEARNVKTSPRTREVMLSLEKELGPDLAASAAITYRRYDRFDWAKFFYPADLYPSTPDLVIDNTGTWYTVAGTVPDTITVDEDTTIDLGDAGGRSWYLPVEDFPGDTPYRLVDKSDSYRSYVGLDLAVTKRLSKRWFMNASLTLQDQRVHWGESFIDPTNQWALDGKPYGNQGTGSAGKADVQMHARWIAKVSGLYQLPAGFSVAATFLAREGWKIPNYIVLAYADPGSWPGPYRSSVVYLQSLTKDRLPALGNLSLRLEKSFSLGPGRMVVMADIFNLLNSAVVNRAYDAYLGTYYVDTEEYAPNPTNRLANEVLNPRVMRLGVRFEF